MTLVEEAARPKTAAPAQPADLATERAIIQLIHRAARLADDQDFLGWMDLFADDGEYSAITNENLKYKGLRLFRDIGRAALHQRVAFLMGLWQVPRAKTTHLVGNVEVTAGESPDEASATSNFIVARTAEVEHTKLHAAGRCHDRFVRQGGAWRIKERLLVIDSNLLPAESTELL
jgi:3-phenylpropionate/cinnamic acid dioxygenase small subunit